MSAAPEWRVRVRDAVAAELRVVPADECTRRWEALPPVAAREARYVLEEDGLISANAAAADVLPAFAAAVAEFHHFEPHRLHDVFPSAPPAAELLAVLAPGVDVSAAAERLRPPVDAVAYSPAGRTHAAGMPNAFKQPDPARYGNYVRSAIICLQLARVATPDRKQQFVDGAATAIRHGLVKRLARSLELPRAEADAWHRAVWPLVGPAAEGNWPAARKALYDLQKLTTSLLDRTRAVAPVEWLLSRGKKPLERPLDRARDVDLAVRLARVETNVRRAGLADADRDRLLDLLGRQRHAAERRARELLTPVVTGVLDRVGLVPANLPERVARVKLVAELVDRACERGFLRLGDLRDALARNQLKLPDLAGPVEFACGDALLRADALLADELFGVYHRGEVYLRAIQRGSALFFGTPVGRLLTLWLLLPFGGAFLGLMFAEELRHIGGKAAAFAGKLLAPRPPDAPAPPAAVAVDDPDEPFFFDPDEAADVVVSTATATPHHHDAGFVTLPAVVGVGLVLLVLIHSPQARRAAFRAARAVGRGLRFVLWDVPHAVAGSAVVRAMWRNPLTRFLARHFGPALSAAAAVAGGVLLFGGTPTRAARWGGFAFLISAAATNTGPGRRLIDRCEAALAAAGRAVWSNFLPGLVTWLAWAFGEVVGAIDRALYAVDETFRYREGATRPKVLGRAALALLWFPVAYLVRFAFYLLIEPQVNPIKHFPVVTVSHKAMLPLVGPLSDALGVSLGTATALISGVPGFFGFLAWELMANWRLYAANRPAAIPAAPVGHHGETGRGLLRPGFHSGTIPKLYRKLRKGWVEGEHSPQGKHAKLHADLHHAEEAVRRQCERELLPLLRAARPTAGLPTEIAGVELGCLTITVRVTFGGGPSAVLVIENEPAGVVGRVEGDWAAGVTAEQRGVIEEAFAGLLAVLAARPGQPVAWGAWAGYWEKRASS